MNVAEQIPQMTDRAGFLDNQIFYHQKRRDKLVEMTRWLERRIEYRNRRIREISAQRTIALNFSLPLQ